MRLLFDQNLSRHLVRHLAGEDPDSEHVTDVGLDTASDREIWDYAADHDLVIVSKDADFRQFAFLHGSPPKAIWLRTGNASNASMLQLLHLHHETIVSFGAADEEAFLVLTPAPEVG